MTDDSRPSLADQRDVETVYQPAEDSNLLAETVIDQIQSNAVAVEAGSRGLDVGTGSGYVADRIHEETAVEMIGCDINPEACTQASDRGIPAVRCDMFEPFRDDSFEIVVCNPPYLPTPPEKEWDDWMERALSGGEDGRAVVDPFLTGIERVLCEDGNAFLLISSLTGPEAACEFAATQGLSSSIVAEQPEPFEKLLVLRFALQ